MDRPRGLTIVGLLALIGGALQIFGSLGLVGIGALSFFIGTTGAVDMAILSAAGFPMWTGALLLVFGAIGMGLGYGLLDLRPWSWALGITLYVLNLLAAIALLLSTGFGVTMGFVAVLSAVILGYLVTPTARAALHHPAGHTFTAGTPHAV